MHFNAIWTEFCKLSDKFLSQMIHEGCLCSRHPDFPTLFHRPWLFYTFLECYQMLLLHFFRKSSNKPCVWVHSPWNQRAVCQCQYETILPLQHYYPKSNEFPERSVFGLGAFSIAKRAIQSRKCGIFSQIFHIFHHSTVFVIVKRLARNYVNFQAFDMYKFGCFENQHFSRLKTAEPVRRLEILKLRGGVWF